MNIFNWDSDHSTLNLHAVKIVESVWVMFQLVDDDNQSIGCKIARDMFRLVNMCEQSSEVNESCESAITTIYKLFTCTISVTIISG